MAIEERKVPLEFTFTPDGIIGPVGSGAFEIIYNPDCEFSDSAMELYPLTINNSGQSICCPIELFTEIVDFLTEKGVIEPKVPADPLPRIATGAAAPAQSTIPLPVIDGVEENVVGQNDGTPALGVVPFTSFDHSRTVNADVIVSEIVAAEVADTTTATPTIKIGEQEVASDEIKTRPVITTRAGDGDSEEDILKTEREAAEMRGTKPSTFRRSD